MKSRIVIVVSRLISRSPVPSRSVSISRNVLHEVTVPVSFVGRRVIVSLAFWMIETFSQSSVRPSLRPSLPIIPLLRFPISYQHVIDKTWTSTIDISSMVFCPAFGSAIANVLRGLWIISSTFFLWNVFCFLILSFLFGSNWKTNWIFMVFFFLLFFCLIGGVCVCVRACVRLVDSDGSRTGSADRRSPLSRQLLGFDANRLRRTTDQIYSHDASRRSRLAHQGNIITLGSFVQLYS